MNETKKDNSLLIHELSTNYRKRNKKTGSSNILVECHRRWQITIENNHQNFSHPAGVQ